MEIRQKLKNFIKNKWAGLCRHTHYVLLGIPFVLALAGLVLGVTAVIRINQILDRQSFQYAAERYESKVMPYRQMTVLGPGLSQGDGSAPRCTEEGLNIERSSSSMKPWTSRSDPRSATQTVRDRAKEVSLSIRGKTVIPLLRHIAR